MIIPFKHIIYGIVKAPAPIVIAIKEMTEPLMLPGLIY